MAQVLSTKKQEASLFMDLNNDIDKLAKLFDSTSDIKKLLFHIEKNALEMPEVALSLLDKTIYRIPLIPMENETETDASYIVINLLISDGSDNPNSATTDISIDILTPPTQWIVNGGLRPLLLADIINKTIRNEFIPTAGVRYRYNRTIPIRLSDRLIGYRLVYESVLEN